MKPETTQDEPMTAGRLATRLKRSRWGVRKALERLNIQPAHVLSGVRYYPASTLGRLEEAMRTANSHAA